MSMPVIIPGTKTRIQAVSDAMISVALEETGLAHILNAEGEKIQAVLALPNVTPDQLLAVNSSVQNLILAINRLEVLLVSKLDNFSCLIEA
ncbi:MAG: hypothetical protein RSE00_00795 [Clostridia bacterium]